MSINISLMCGLIVYRHFNPIYIDNFGLFIPEIRFSEYYQSKKSLHSFICRIENFVVGCIPLGFRAVLRCVFMFNVSKRNANTCHMAEN